MGITAAGLISRVQVNIPFPYLFSGYLEKFLEQGLNPEIGLDGYSLAHYPPGALRGVGRAFLKAGRRLTLHAPFQDMAPGALDDGVLAACRGRLRRAFRQLPLFQPVAVVCHLGFDERHYGWNRREWLDRAAATFKELAAAARAHGAALMLENVYETDPEIFLEVLDRVKAPNLKVCFDVGHLLAFSTGDFPRWLKALAPVIGQLHLHDNHGDHDTHLALGTGKVPLKEVLDYLAAAGRRPLITLEPHQEGSLNPSLEYLAAIWPWD